MRNAGSEDVEQPQDEIAGKRKQEQQKASDQSRTSGETQPLRTMNVSRNRGKYDGGFDRANRDQQRHEAGKYTGRDVHV